MNIRRRDAVETHETPFGAVGVLHDGADLQAWWIWKDDEQIDPQWSALPHEDLLYVIEGKLRLELEGEEPRDLSPGDCFVIPARRHFRGYRWPCDGQPCLFLAVSAKPREQAMAAPEPQRRLNRRDHALARRT